MWANEAAVEDSSGNIVERKTPRKQEQDMEKDERPRYHTLWFHGSGQPVLMRTHKCYELAVLDVATHVPAAINSVPP